MITSKEVSRTWNLHTPEPWPWPHLHLIINIYDSQPWLHFDSLRGWRWEVSFKKLEWMPVTVILFLTLLYVSRPNSIPFIFYLMVYKASCGFFSSLCHLFCPTHTFLPALSRYSQMSPVWAQSLHAVLALDILASLIPAYENKIWLGHVWLLATPPTGSCVQMFRSL
jgi:hypothetical protein